MECSIRRPRNAQVDWPGSSPGLNNVMTTKSSFSGWRTFPPKVTMPWSLAVSKQPSTSSTMASVFSYNTPKRTSYCSPLFFRPCALMDSISLDISPSSQSSACFAECSLRLPPLTASSKRRSPTPETPAQVTLAPPRRAVLARAWRRRRQLHNTFYT